MVQPEVKTTKRKPYKKKECPYCHNHFGNLDNHIRMKHSAGAEVEPGEDPGVTITKESLLGEKPPQGDKPGGTTYYCQDCKAIVRKGEGKCWNCGIALIWEGIE